MIWPRERFAGVLLQAGVSAALPHLAERVKSGDENAGAIAGQIIETWENPPTVWSYRSLDNEPSRAEMLRLLVKLRDRALLKRFIGGVVTHDFDGSENAPLAAAIQLLGPKEAGKLLSTLARENMPLFHRGFVTLFVRVLRQLGEKLSAEWQSALRDAAAVMVRKLPEIKPAADPYESANWQSVQKAKPVNAAMVADLLGCLGTIGADKLRKDAAARFVSGVAVFDPGQVIVPALTLLQERERKGSPQTLVCTKTRRTFQRQCGQHRADCASMNALLDVMQPVPKELAKLAARLAAAKELKPQT